MHIVLVAGAAVVVLGAAAGGLAYGLADRAHVAVSTTAASSSADRVDVLALVVAAADAKFATGGQHEQPGVTSDPVATVHRAVSLGVIGAADSDWAATHGSLTRATYALWIWRALGDRLESVRQATFSDLGGLSEEVRRAVMAVAGAGILEGTEDGRFEPDRVLTQKEVDESIRRLEHMLGLSAE